MRILIALSALLLLSTALSACQEEVDPEAKPPDATPGPEHPVSLRAQIREVVAQAKGGDAAAVAKAMEPFILSEGELKALFGDAQGAIIWQGYSKKIVPALRTEVGPVLVERVKAGQVEVEVHEVGQGFPGRSTTGDLALLDRVKRPVRMYTVRLKAPDAGLGFRLDGFVYLDGQWRMLLKSHMHLEAPDASPPDAAPPADAGVPADAN